MSFNPLDPAQMDRARAVVAKIKDRLAAAEIESRMADVRATERDIEAAYRQREVDVDVARRGLADAKAMLAERDGELVAVAAAMTVTSSKPKYTPAQRDKELTARLKKDPAFANLATKLKELEGRAGADQAAVDHIEQAKTQVREEQQQREAAIAAEIDRETIEEETPRFTTEMSRKNGALALRKEDDEYLALKANVRTKEQELEAAERAFAEAKTDYNILLREDKRISDDKALLGAEFVAFADLNVPPAARAAATPTQAAPAQSAA